MAILTATIRLAFGMARDDQLPASKLMAKVNPRLHTPVGACIVVGLLSAIPFIQFAGVSTIAVAATASIYFAYLLGNLAVMRARMRGWPRAKAPFSLGGWGMLVNAVAVIWGIAMFVNFLWPASTSGSGAIRVATNPSAEQTGGLVNFHIGFLNKISLIELVIGIVSIVGAIYYFAAQRRKPYEPVVIPDEQGEIVIPQVAPETSV
jgi:amino acid transporter